MDVLASVAKKIIEDQETIIGPIALEQAKKVPGLNIDWNKHEVRMEGNKTTILEGLVEQYKNLFGQASVEVCKGAVNNFRAQITPDQLPLSLR